MKRKNRQETAAERPSNVIQNCTLYGVKWDKPALECLQTVATALLNLTQLFRSTGMDVPMIEIRGDEMKVNGRE